MRLVKLLCILFIAHAPPVSADIFSDAWSVVADPLGLRESSSTAYHAVDRALLGLQKLQADFDEDVSKQIEEMKFILKELDSGVEKRIQQAEESALKLEGQIVADAFALIEELECSVERVTNEKLQRATQSLINQILSTNPKVKIPVFGNLELTYDSAASVEPDIRYKELKKVRERQLKDLMAKLGDQTPANAIVSMYQNNAELAYWTQCHYAKSGGATRFLKEHLEQKRLLTPWVTVVHVPL